MSTAAITGMGVVCALGSSVDAFFKGLQRGESALSPVEGIPIARGKQLGGQVKAPAFAGPHHLSMMLQSALAEAIAQAGLSTAQLAETALYLGTVASESRILEDQFRSFVSAERLSPSLQDGLLRYGNGALADRMAEHFGIGGPREVNTNACASGNIALARAVVALRSGRIRRAIVCGADQLKPILYWGAERAGLMGHDVRPFHRHRDGTAFGDGAAALVLEAAELAAQRGAKVFAEVRGFGLVCDENPQLILPQLDGGAAARAFQQALFDAGVDPDQVDYVNAHGTGTINIDRIEAVACKRVFGERAKNVPVSSTKSLTGHLSSASPIVEAIATTLAISHSYIHPTAKLDDPDPELGLDFVPLTGRDQTVKIALSNAMGGGGTNAAVVITAPGAVTRARPQHQAEEIVITGRGALSVFGSHDTALDDGLFGAGKRGASGRIEDFSVSQFVDRELKYEHLSRAAQLALGAGLFAEKQARVTEHVHPDRLAVLFGTAFGGTPSWSELLCDAYERDPRHITPNMALEHGHHLGVTLLARHLPARGANCTLTTGATAGLEAIGFASELLAQRVCDAALVGASESLDRLLDRGLTLLGCAQSAAHDLVPYAADNHGLRLGEGAAAFVLERRSDALARGAKILGTVRGFASAAASVGVGRWDVQCDALGRAMSEALERAAVRSAELLVMGAANGVSGLEQAELRALTRVARERDLTPRLVSIHGVLGETFAAGALLALTSALSACSRGVVPRWCARDRLPAALHLAAPLARLSTRHVLINAAAAGGAAAALCVELPVGSDHA